MISSCAQETTLPENMPDPRGCISVTGSPRPNVCEAVSSPLLRGNILADGTNVPSSNLRPHNLPSIHAGIPHLDANRGSIPGNLKQLTPCTRQSFNNPSLNVGQPLNSQSQNNMSSLPLSSCDSQILVSNQVTMGHQNMIPQIGNNEPNNQNHMSMNEQLNPVSPSLPNSNQHIIVNLMNSAANQPELSSVTEMSNSGLMLSHQIESGISSVLTQPSGNGSMQHQLLSTASPGLTLSQNYNLSSLPMNLLMPDPMSGQSNGILTSYNTAGCGNYSPFDSSVSWLTDNRNFYDRSFNNSRLGVLENIGLCSPNSVESLSRTSKEGGNYSKCLPSLDPVQSWLSLSSINQSTKYADQISPTINLLHFEPPAELQKFDLSHKSTESLKSDLENKTKCESPKNKLNYNQLAITTEFTDYEYGLPCINNVTPYSVELSKFSYSFPKNDYPPISEIHEDSGKGKQMLLPCAKSGGLKYGEFGSVKKVADCSISNQPDLFDEKLTRNDCMEAGESCDNIDLDGDGSEESDIIVEDSDSRSADEEQNEISVDSVKTILIDEDIDFSRANSSSITLRCFICNLSTTTMPATQFIHTNSEFPVTSASKTPIITKLLEFVPVELRKYVSIENHFLCCRCFNLIETVESLEVKLRSVKDVLNETLARTVTIIDIHDGKTKEIGALEELPSELFQPESPEQNAEMEESGSKVELPADFADGAGLEACKDSVTHKQAEKTPEVVELPALKAGKTRVTTSEGELAGPRLNSSQIACEECGQSFESSVSLENHLTLHGKFSAFCSDCGKGFKTKSKLSQHLLIHNGNFNFLCEVCGKPFRQKHHLEDHVLKHFGKFKHCCKVCGKGFMQKSTLSIHETMHAPHDAQICQHCGKKFSNKWNLTAHISFCTRALSFSCSFCEKKFNEKRRLEDHVQAVHENNHKFSCQECKKGFMKKSSLDSHMVVHSSLKAFVCQKCGKSYKTLSNLNQHSKVHSVSAQFRCTLCDEKFLRKSNLEAHINNHKGQKPYKCGRCEKIFASEHYLKIHAKQHDRSKVVCQDCGKQIKGGVEGHRKNCRKRAVVELQQNQT